MVHSNVLCLKNKAKIEYIGGARAAPTPSNAYTQHGHPTSKSVCIEIHRSASRSIQLSTAPKRQAIQRRPSYLGVPPRPRYKFTRRLGAPYCNVIVARHRMEPRLALWRDRTGYDYCRRDRLSRVDGGRGDPSKVGQLRSVACANAEAGSQSVPSYRSRDSPSLERTRRSVFVSSAL